jgi:hypothetical protein
MSSVCNTKQVKNIIKNYDDVSNNYQIIKNYGNNRKSKFYIFKFFDNQKVYIKIGFTTQFLIKRIYQLRREYNIDNIELLAFCYLEENIESQFKDLHKDFNIKIKITDRNRKEIYDKNIIKKFFEFIDKNENCYDLTFI